MVPWDAKIPPRIRREPLCQVARARRVHIVEVVAGEQQRLGRELGGEVHRLVEGLARADALGITVRLAVGVGEFSLEARPELLLRLDLPELLGRRQVVDGVEVRVGHVHEKVLAPDAGDHDPVFPELKKAVVPQHNVSPAFHEDSIPTG